MAATVNRDIETRPTPLIRADVGDGSGSRPQPAGISVALYLDAGASLFRPNAAHALLLSTASASANSLFYGGCVVVTEPGDDGDSEVLYTTSSLLQTTDSAQLPVVLITRIVVQRSAAASVAAVSWTKLRPPPNMPMPAAMVPYRDQSVDGVLYCAQGNLSPRTSGLFFMPHGRRPRPLVDAFGGAELNSVRDVTVHPRDGALWFTDPHTGFDHDFRNAPQLPNHVYRCDAATAETRVVDDSLQRPTSLCFDAAGTTLYVSDASTSTPHSSRPGARRAAVYAYDVVDRSGGAFLVNRRVFAYCVQGPPLCIRCDGVGNVYCASGSRIEVRSAGGSLVAAVDVPGPSSVSSFCFTSAACDEMFVCAGQELWWVRL